jgi:glyoxylase-like metal-dependent hydrolase (beta-lactamase superfamily II)
MDRLWGEFLPVPENNLRVLSGGERVLVGGEEFEVAYTPGHASHHVSYLHRGTAFVGDVGGVRIIPESLTIPPTPPPDIDVEAWHESLDTVRSWRPERLAFTHFGAAEDVDSQLDELGERLDGWAAKARDETQEQFITRVHGEIEAVVKLGTTPAYEQAAPPEQLYAGLTRYWTKRAEREAQ